MAFSTKQKLNNTKFDQFSGGTLTLSGTTTIDGLTGDMNFSSHKIFDHPQQVVDKQYVDERIAVVSGDTIYRLGSPATVQVGGVNVGHVLTGLTSNEILQDILYPELCGTLTAPFIDTISLTNGVSSYSIHEVGSVVSFDVSATFNKGCINPQYCSATEYRSGNPVSYNFGGIQVGAVPSTSLSQTTPVSNYTTLFDNNWWTVNVDYSAGPQPKTNFGHDFDDYCPAGNCPNKSTYYKGCYPYFWGTSSSVPIPGSALLTTALGKCVCNSDGTIQVNNGVSTSYTWFAVPADSTTKQGWYEGPTNKGNIGIIPDDIFNAPVLVGVNSPDNLWTNIDYNIYSTNLKIVNGGTNVCYTNAKQQ